MSRIGGYTLIELLVTISIIGIMVAFLVGSYSLGKGHDTVAAENSKFVSAVRVVRNRSFNGIISPFGSYPAGGYGIHIYTSLIAPNPQCPNTKAASCYTLFADQYTAPLPAPAPPPAFDSTAAKVCSTTYVPGCTLNAQCGSSPAVCTTEFVQEYGIPSTVNVVFPTIGATEAEIIFHDQNVSVAEKVGAAWQPYNGNGSIYPIKFQFGATTCSASTMVATTTLNIYDSLSC